MSPKDPFGASSHFQEAIRADRITSYVKSDFVTTDLTPAASALAHMNGDGQFEEIMIGIFANLGCCASSTANSAPLPSGRELSSKIRDTGPP